MLNITAGKRGNKGMFSEELKDELLSQVVGGIEGYPDVCGAYKNTAEGLEVRDGIVLYPGCPFPKVKGTIAFCNDCICNRSRD